MPEILKPLTFDDLPVQPPLVGRPRMSEDLQQTVALLVGWDKRTRRLVYVNPQGVLHTASPPVKGIINALATSAGFQGQGSDITTSEVLIRANPANTGIIWLNVGIEADENVGYPLEAGEWICFSAHNLLNVHYHFTTKDDRGIIVYTK